MISLIQDTLANQPLDWEEKIKQPIGHSLLNGLVGYWPLDDARNSSANTTQRELHQGLVMSVNNVPQDAQGVYGGQASQFNSADTRFLFRASSSAIQVSDADYSWVVWAYLDAKASSKGIWTKSDYSAASTREWELLHENAADRFRFSAYNGTSLVTTYANTLGVPATSTWYFIYADHDSVNNLLGISVNAGTKDTVAFTGGMTTGTTEMRFGAWAHPTTPLYWDGRIMMASMWRRLLTAEERTYLYAGGIGRKYPWV